LAFVKGRGVWERDGREGTLGSEEETPPFEMGFSHRNPKPSFLEFFRKLAGGEFLLILPRLLIIIIAFLLFYLTTKLEKWEKKNI
jgi:hypothetical protein